MPTNTEALKTDAKLNCARCGHSERHHQPGVTFCGTLIYGQGLCPCAGFVPPVLPTSGVRFARQNGGVQYRSFFVDVHFDEAGAFVGLQVQEHGERKDATDERGLAQAIKNYFDGKGNYQVQNEEQI